jgi:DHA3 family tetracycline resistance protein-like MFS transporter
LNLKFVEPLKIRDFSVYWAGQTVSLLGDGIFLVAIAWQVYDLWNDPTALSVVGAIETAPLVLLLAVGGVVTDRVERRWVLVWSSAVRGACVATIGLLGALGALELWQIFVITVVYGAGMAFQAPASGAIVPDLVPDEHLVQANSLAQVIRPIAMSLVGPALGGLVVHVAGAPSAFLLDAGSYVFAMLMLAQLHPQPAALQREEHSSVLADIKEGWRFVRSHVWLWGTLVWATAALFLVYAPFEVLVPYLVKNELHGNAGDLGLVFAAGGTGAVLTAIVVGQRGLPRRHITFMYGLWGIASLALPFYALATASWQAMVVAAYAEACWTAGELVWVTMLQRLVPRDLLGRVRSLDWLLSSGLAPLSFALCGPVAVWLGVDFVLAVAGVAAFGLTVGFYFLPGMRDTELDGHEARVVLREPETENVAA